MSKLKTLVLAVVGALALVGSAGSAALAVAEINITPGHTLKGPGIALHGYDPVAFFTKSAPVLGSAEYSVAHRGATYRFENEDHLNLFKSDPERYVPAYGGFCAYGVSVSAKFDGDPRYWKVVDGKLYLNLNQSIQKTWLEDVPGNIRKADQAWEDIRSKDPSTLG